MGGLYGGYYRGFYGRPLLRLRWLWWLWRLWRLLWRLWWLPLGLIRTWPNTRMAFCLCSDWAALVQQPNTVGTYSVQCVRYKLYWNDGSSPIHGRGPLPGQLPPNK